MTKCFVTMDQDTVIGVFEYYDVAQDWNLPDAMDVTTHQDLAVIGLGSTYDPQTDRYTAPPSQLE